MLIEVETFVAALTVSEFNSLVKVSHLTVALLQYKLSASDSITKTQLKKLVLQYLHDEAIIPRDSDLLEPTMMGEELLTLRWLELQEKERERESQLKLKETEFREKELQVHW